jgi:hypothetical protein
VARRGPSRTSPTARARPGRLSDLSVSYSKCILHGALVWARRVLSSPKRRFPARAVDVLLLAGQALEKVGNLTGAAMLMLESQIHSITPKYHYIYCIFELEVIRP